MHAGHGQSVCSRVVREQKHCQRADWALAEVRSSPSVSNSTTSILVRRSCNFFILFLLLHSPYPSRSPPYPPERMSDSFQTPFPTDSSRSQAFALKTTRPNDAVPRSRSPVPRSSKPTVKRVYARKRSLHGHSSSLNLKENSFHSKSGSGTTELKLNLRSKLRARRTTSFASLQDRKKESEGHSGPRLGRKSSRASSRRSLDSPFCSQPSSPNRDEPAPNAQVSRSNSNRNISSGSESGDPCIVRAKATKHSNL
jgi:hypothetical protein